MAEYDLMKFFSLYEEAEMGDFSIEELEAHLREEGCPLSLEEIKRRYFEFYDDVKDKSLKRQDW